MSSQIVGESNVLSAAYGDQRDTYINAPDY